MNLYALKGNDNQHMKNFKIRGQTKAEWPQDHLRNYPKNVSCAKYDKKSRVNSNKFAFDKLIMVQYFRYQVRSRDWKY